MSFGILGGLGGKLLGSVGGPIGSIVGGFLGSTLGSLLDPKAKGQRLTAEGPRLQDLTVQTSTYGSPIPIVYGSVRIAGNMIWSTDIIETTHVETENTGGGGGGKGGGKPKNTLTTTTYTYSASFALGLCEGVILGVDRIWADKKLIWDSATPPLNPEVRLDFIVYTGTEAQEVSPVIEAVVGVGETPAYRGMAYVVFDDLQLATFGNRIPNFTFEVISVGTQTVTSSLYSGPGAAIELDPATGLIWATGNGTQVDVINPETMLAHRIVQLTDGVAQVTYQPEYTYQSIGITGPTFITVPARMWAGHAGPALLTDVDPTAIETDSYFADELNLSESSGWWPGEVIFDTRMTPPKLLTDIPLLLLSSVNGAATGTEPIDTLDKVATTETDTLAWDWIADMIIGGDSMYVVNYYGVIRKIGTAPAFSTEASVDLFSNSINHNLAYDPVEPALYAKGNSGSGDNLHKLNPDTLATIWERDFGSDIAQVEYHQGSGDIWVVQGTNPATFFRVDPSDGTTLQTITADFNGANITELILYPNSPYAFVSVTSVGVYKIPLVPANTAGTVLLSTIVADLLQRGGLVAADYHVANLFDVVTGYAVTGRMPIRNAIEPLMQAFYFDLPESDYQLKGVKRGRIEGTIGKTAVGASSTTHGANQKMVKLVTVPGLFYAKSLFLHVPNDEGTQEFQGVIYTDVAGVPTALVGVSNANTNILSGWNEMVFAAEVALIPGTYWIGVLMKVAGNYTHDSVTDALKWSDDTYSDGAEDPFGPLATLSFELSVYLTASVPQTIPWADLAAHPTGDTPPDPITIQRTQEVELPNHINVNYIEQAADYTQSTQMGRRLVTGSLDKTTIEVPVVMDAAKGKQISDVVLHNSWVERDKIAFTSSRKYVDIDPADVITLTMKADGTTKAVRVTKVDFQFPGIVSMEAVEEDLTIYDFGQAGVSSSLAAQTISVISPTRLELMDIPMLRDLDNDAGFYGAASGVLSGWSFAELHRSIDEGQSWTFLDLFTTAAAMGSAVTVLADVSSPYTWDRTNHVFVTLTAGTLTSSTEANVLNNANAALIGNEIIQFVSAVSTAVANQYKLTTLLRGRRGTEMHTGSHAAGDRFVLLNAAALARIQDTTDDLNSFRTYKAISGGQTIGQAASRGFVNTGKGLKPYAPSGIAGTRYNDDLIITWNGRARMNGGWIDGVDVPLAESSLEYEVDVMNGATVVRTIASLTTETTTYTSAQQVTDFGSAQASVEVNIYQKSGLVARGFAGNATV